MNARNSILLLCAAVAVGGLVHCGGSATPTQPPVTTLPQPTTTTTTQPAGIVLPAGMVCDPTPAPLYGISVKVWSKTTPGRWIIDTHPLIKNIDGYCGRVGLGDTAKYCFARPEGDPQLVACDYLAVGQASDTGRWGPTWTYNGQLCEPPGQPGGGGCTNDPNNQFKVLAKAAGRFEACASPLARLDPEEGSRCGVRDVPNPF